MSARIAVVTGGSRGIGFEICRQLAQKGVNVVLTTCDPERGQKAVASLQRDGLNAIFHTLDVTRPQQIRRLTAYMRRSHGRCDILVNNAGILGDKRGASVLDLSVETMRSTLETNFYAPLQILQGLCR